MMNNGWIEEEVDINPVALPAIFEEPKSKASFLQGPHMILRQVPLAF